jgi:hypothetical protein
VRREKVEDTTFNVERLLWWMCGFVRGRENYETICGGEREM